MDASKWTHVSITKNRGWRGLAKIIVSGDTPTNILQSIYSFSAEMWYDLIVNHAVVLQDSKNYYVVRFEDKEGLPRPDQQRSVLIKNFLVKITDVSIIDKATGVSDDYDAVTKYAITHFKRNSNRHTTSDWNCIGVRVVPEI